MKNRKTSNSGRNGEVNMKTQLAGSPLSSGWQAGISRVLIFTVLCCAFVGGLGWFQPNLADAETLSAPTSVAIAPTGNRNATSAYVIMSRITATSSGAVLDGKIELNSLTLNNPGTANVAAGRVYLSTTATTTLPTDAVQIGRTSGLWTAATSTTIVLSSGTTTQRTVLTTTPGYLYIVFDMLSTEAGKTTSANVTAIGVVTTGGDTNPAGMSLSSNVVTLVAGGAKATVVNCYDCHGDQTKPNMDNATRSAVTGSFVGSHNKHAGALGYACTSCHASNTGTNHRDGYVDMASPTFFGGTYSKGTPTRFAQSTSLIMGTCNTVYCHSNGAGTNTVPTWGAAAMPVDCTGCHGGNNGTATKIATNAHTGHISTNSGRSIGCVECHSATVTNDTTISAQGLPLHANQFVNVRFNNGTNLDSEAPTYNGNPATSVTTSGSQKAALSATGSCSNVYCHSIGNLNAGVLVPAGGQSYTTINWNVASIGCDGCHGVPGKSHPTYAGTSAGTTTANSHVKHVESNGLGCTYCHNLTTTGTGTTAASLTLKSGGTTSHINRVEDVSFSSNGGATGTYNLPAKTCSTNYCHGVSKTSPAWGGATTCSSCHGANNNGELSASGATGHAIHFAVTTTATSLTQSDDFTTGYAYGCQSCHPTNQHATGKATAYSAATVTGTRITSAQYTATTTTLTDVNGYSYTNGACAVNTCHSNGQGGNAISQVTWTAAKTTPNCGVCHNKAGDAGPVWTAPHNKHITSYSANTNISCASCHVGTASSNTSLQTTTTARTQHPNGLRDLAMNTFATGSIVAIGGTQGSQTCSNTYCHSTGIALAGTHTAISWTGTTTCGSCHAASPATGAHAKHLATSTAAGAITCNRCHNATASSNTVISNFTNHVDKTVTIALDATSSGATATYAGSIVGGGTSTSKQPGSAAGTCNTTNCHGGNSQTWTTVNGDATCVKCHGVATATAAQFSANPDIAAPGYISTAPVGTGVNTSGNPGVYSGGVSNDKKVGAHDTHNRGVGAYKTGGIACTECHAVTALNSPGHMDGSTTFTWGALATTSGATPTYSTATGACATNYCHGGAFGAGVIGTDPTPTWTDGTYLVNSASAMNSADCNKCHLSPPTSTLKYDHSGVTFGAGACNSCHQHDGSGATHMDGILYGVGMCNSCHDYDVDAITGDWGKSPKAVEGWGAHATHISHLKSLTTYTLNPSADAFGGPAYNAICGVCHTRTTSLHSMSSTTNVRSINFGDAVASSPYSFGTGTPLYNGLTGTSSASTAKTCSNVSCHYQTTPIWQGY